MANTNPTADHPLERFLQSDDALHVGVDGQMLLASSGRCPPTRVVLPGSFNPMHRGHWELARVAERITGQPVAFEISVANVDKPSLECEHIRKRLTPFNWQAAVWLTHAPKFVHKAERFPGATFVVGVDTALRIVSPRYYHDDSAAMLAALGCMADLRCRFLVACRVDAQGKCLHVGDVPIPPYFAELFQEIPAEQFRWDISSTQLRARGGSV